MGETDLWTLTTIVGLTAVTVISRSFFFLSDRPWSLPGWAQRGLQYAPIAALSAVIAPEIVMSQGHLIDSVKDARLIAAGVGIAFFAWRRGQGQALLGTISVGMAVYLPLHLILGW